MKRYQEYELPWLILCEGEADKRFIDTLIDARNIPRVFHVEFPNNGGRSQFGKRLRALYDANEPFRANIKNVLIVADNDDNPAASFADVTNQLKVSGFPVPKQAHTRATKKEYPTVTILMVPIGVPGNLETLCLDAAHHKWGLAAALDAFVSATPAHGWPLSKNSKTRLQAILASTCRKKPDTSFAVHWTLDEEYRIPIDHASFDGIADFIRGLATAP